MLLEILLLIVSFTLYWFLVAVRPPPNFPKGPRLILPFLGNALMVGDKFTECYERLRKVYGDVFSLYYGPYRTVVICDFDLIQEAGNSLDLAYRPQTYLIQQLRGGSILHGGVKSCGGLIFGNGPSWAEQRRFTLHNLRNLGFGKSSMEELISEELTKLCKHLEDFQGEPVVAKWYFNMATVNALWHVVAGSTLDYDDPKLKKVIRFVDDAAKEKGGPIKLMIFFYKALAQLVLSLKMVKSVEAFDNIRQFIRSMIQDHRKSFQDDNLRDFIDVYLKEMKDQLDQKNDASSFVGEPGDINALNIIMDLFLAGTDTSSSTLNWSMLLLLQNPDVLDKLQKELDAVTNRARLPTYSDRPNTPYAEAVVTEVQRMANIAPIVNHLAARDTVLGGKYFIPKDTRISLNIGAAMMDPVSFPDPEKFDPTRHLDSNGKFEPHPKVIPFSVGRRRCPGETLAKMSLYMFLTGLVSHFDLKKVNDDDVLDRGEIIQGRLLDSIKPVTLRFVPRT